MIYEIIILLLLSQLLLGIYLWYWVKDLYKYPNLFGFPIIGNLYYFYKGFGSSSLDASYRYHKRIAEKHGDGKCFTFLNGRLALLLSCPHLVEKIAYHPNINDKPYIYSALNGIMKGVFTYCHSDDEWKLRRKELNNCLTKNLIENHYFDDFQRVAKDMVETIAANTKNLDAAYNIRVFTINVIKATFCGIKKIIPLNRASCRTLHILEVLSSFAMATPMLGSVIMNVVAFAYRLFLDETSKPSKKVLNSVEQELNISEKRSTEERKNLPLLLIIALRNKQRNLTARDFELEFRELLVVGSHTVAVALTGAIASLAVHCEIQEKAWKEQFEIFGTDTRDPTVEDVKNMLYLDRFWKETLRFFAPPHIAKRTAEDINLDGVVVPAGTSVGILLHKMRMDPNYWKNPEVFDPDRFLEENSRPKYSYSPFGVGVRSCPGMQYSKYEMKIALSAVLRQFKLTSTQKFEDFRYEMHIMTEISNLLSLQVEQRKY